MDAQGRRERAEVQADVTMSREPSAISRQALLSWLSSRLFRTYLYRFAMVWSASG